MTLNEVKCADTNSSIKRFSNTFIWRNKNPISRKRWEYNALWSYGWTISS